MFTRLTQYLNQCRIKNPYQSCSDVSQVDECELITNSNEVKTFKNDNLFQFTFCQTNSATENCFDNEIMMIREPVTSGTMSLIFPNNIK